MLPKYQVLYIYSVLHIGLSRFCSAKIIPEYGCIKDPEKRLRLQTLPSNWWDAQVRCQLIGILLSNTSISWAKGEPDNIYNENCLVLTGNGEVADVSCNSLYPYFCYMHGHKMTETCSETSDSQVSKCGTSDNGYTWEPRTGSCYKFHRVALPWLRASMVCTNESATLAVINSNLESQVLKELYAQNPPDTHIGSETNFLVHIGALDWNQRGNWLTVFGGMLASPTTPAMKKAMIGLMAANKLTKKVFTGIRASSPKGSFVDLDGTPISNVSWADGEPNNKFNGEDCVAMTSAGETSDVDCDSVYPYICFKTNAMMSKSMCGKADKGYKLQPKTGSCYRFYREPRSWRRALMACNADRAYLAVVNSDEEAEVIQEIFTKNPPETIKGSDYTYIAHVGIWDWNQHGNWVTIFGKSLEDAGFAEWDEHQPNNLGGEEFCGAVSRDGLLHDIPCVGKKYAYICEISSK